MQSKTRNRKKTTKIRKSQEEDDLRGLVLPPPQKPNDDSRHYATDEIKPPLPPLPVEYGYKKLNYEKIYDKNSGFMTKYHLNSQNKNLQQIYPSNETNLEHQNRLIYQRQLSKSVGDNLQQQQAKPKFSTLDNKNRSLRQCLSAGDLLGKTHEELILLLIQLKRNQSQLKHTIEKLNLQMESEDKLSMIEPHKIAEHKLKYEQVKEQLVETQKQYDSQFPLIDLIDNMVKVNTSSRSNLNNPIYGYCNQITNNGLNSLSSNNVHLSSTNEVPKATSTTYLNHLDDKNEHPNNKISNHNNDESDYAGESDTNNMESSYTNRSSCTTGIQLNTENHQQDLTTTRDQASSHRNLEVLSVSSSQHKKKHHNSQQSKTSAEQTSSQATTSTLSSVIASAKQMHSNMNSQINQKQSSINQTVKSKNVIAEKEMELMKEQQILLEAELERVRSLLLNSQLNVQQSNLNDDLSIATTTENHFQAELDNIDQEINNLNAKKEKLIQSLKRKDNHKKSNKDKLRSEDQFLNVRMKEIEDGTDLFTDDDAIFSTVNSMDFERVLDDGLSLCTDVDDLELSKHENEYVQSLKAEYEQNLKQEEERKKLELEKLQEQERKQLEQIKSTTTNEDDETTTETTIYKTLRLVKRKYESSKLNKQLTFDSGDLLRIDKGTELNRINVDSDNEVDKLKKDAKKLSTNLQTNRLKIKNDANKKDEISNGNKSVKQTNKNDLLTQPSQDDLLPSEISQLLLDSALIIYEQLKPPKRSTASSISSERSIDEQSDDDILDGIIQQNSTNIIKQQPKVSSNLIPSISATLLDLNRDLSRDLNRNIEREINNIHHSTKLNHHRSPANHLIENKRMMRRMMFDADYELNKLNDVTKLDSKLISVNGRDAKNKKKVTDKSTYASAIELEEERARIF